MRGATGITTEEVRAAGWRAARRERWRINRSREHAVQTGAGYEGGEATCLWPPAQAARVAGEEAPSRKRRAPAGWGPEERRVAARRRLAEHMERARAGAMAARAAEGDADAEGAHETSDVEMGDATGGEGDLARIDDG